MSRNKHNLDRFPEIAEIINEQIGDVAWVFCKPSHPERRLKQTLERRKVGFIGDQSQLEQEVRAGLVDAYVRYYSGDMEGAIQSAREVGDNYLPEQIKIVGKFDSERAKRTLRRHPLSGRERT